MSDRLTKKQRKSLAHKERGKVKRAAMLKAMDFERNAVPKQDLEEEGDDDDEKVTPMLEHEDKRTSPSTDAPPRSSSKRKRDENEDIDSPPAQAILPDSNGITAKSAKKRKTQESAAATPLTAVNDAKEQDKAKSNKRRYILFVGEQGSCARLRSSLLTQKRPHPPQGIYRIKPNLKRLLSTFQLPQPRHRIRLQSPMTQIRLKLECSHRRPRARANPTPRKGPFFLAFFRNIFAHTLINYFLPTPHQLCICRIRKCRRAQPWSKIAQLRTRWQNHQRRNDGWWRWPRSE